MTGGRSGGERRFYSKRKRGREAGGGRKRVRVGGVSSEVRRPEEADHFFDRPGSGRPRCDWLPLPGRVSASHLLLCSVLLDLHVFYQPHPLIFEFKALTRARASTSFPARACSADIKAG